VGITRDTVFRARAECSCETLGSTAKLAHKPVATTHAPTRYTEEYLSYVIDNRFETPSVEGNGFPLQSDGSFCTVPIFPFCA
jgi:hypothetical protein